MPGKKSDKKLKEQLIPLAIAKPSQAKDENNDKHTKEEKHMTHDELKVHKQEKLREAWLSELRQEKEHTDMHETEQKQMASERKESDEGSAEIKGIVFDFGKVIVENNLNDILKAYAKKLGIKADELIKLNLKHHDKMILGKMSVKEFCSEVRGRFNLDTESYLLLSHWDKSYEETSKPNWDLINKIKELKKYYHTALLANIYDSTAQFESRRGTFWLFKTIQLSCRVGLAKPDIKAYARILQEMKLKGKECIFIDDNENNLIPAKEFGFKTILYKNNLQVVKDMKKFGVKLENPPKVKKVKTWPNSSNE